MEIDIGISSMCVYMNVGSRLHRTGSSIILFTPTNGQNAGDLMPNGGKREKGLKCGSLPLNARELAALHPLVPRVQDAPAHRPLLRACVCPCVTEGASSLQKWCTTLDCHRPDCHRP